MKKSLFTLMVAATATYGVTLEQALLTTTASVTDLSTLTHSSNQYTLTIKLNKAGIDFLNNFVGSNRAGKAVCFASIGLNSLATTEGAEVAEHLYGVGMGYSSTQAGTITTGGFYNTKEATPTTGTTNHFNGGGSHLFDSTEFNENLTGVAITLYGLNSSSQPAITATMTHAGGSTAEYNSLTYTGGKVTDDAVTGWTNLYLNSQYIENAWLFDGMVVNNQATAQALNRLAIATPEPATATLSLLALAGLASRRRRH